MIYFTADTHFGHANIIKYCGRPYSTVEEMDQALIANWNNTVSGSDTVYHLGDFAWKQARSYREQLNGSIHLIRGNHDGDKNRKIDESLFASVSDLKEIRIEGQKIILCHYAMRVWNASHHGSWHFYGHSHGTLPLSGNGVDVGVDCWDYKPITLEEVTK